LSRNLYGQTHCRLSDKSAGMDDFGVMVIEDSPDVALLFEESARLAQMPVEVVRDGQAAMKRLSEVTPKAIILDLHLPFVSGTEILRYLKSEVRFDQTRIIVASADADLAQSLESQVDFALVKPVGYAHLYKLVTLLQ
jgi:DNA-binding response OmpR family regulator